MPITGKKSVKSAFYNYVIDQQKNAKKAVINVLTYVGLECVKEARENGKYIDRTGNLRSSVGYAILENGKAIKKSKFEKVMPTANQASKKGKALIDSLASTYNTGLVLVVVAGMNYAVYVEAKGLNVLNSAETMAKTLVPQMLKQLGLKK